MGHMSGDPAMHAPPVPAAPMGHMSGDPAMHPEVDISHCAHLPPATRPACEAQAHDGPPPGMPPMTAPPAGAN